MDSKHTKFLIIIFMQKGDFWFLKSPIYLLIHTINITDLPVVTGLPTVLWRKGWAELSWIELNWAELSRIELSWAGLNRTKLNWVELSWVELNWAELCWIELSWAGLNRTKPNWVKLNCAELSWFEQTELNWIELDLAELTWSLPAICYWWFHNFMSLFVQFWPVQSSIGQNCLE